jgi:hypothetical protein
MDRGVLLLLVPSDHVQSDMVQLFGEADVRYPLDDEIVIKRKKENGETRSTYVWFTDVHRVSAEIDCCSSLVNAQNRIKLSSESKKKTTNKQTNKQKI